MKPLHGYHSALSQLNLYIWLRFQSFQNRSEIKQKCVKIYKCYNLPFHYRFCVKNVLIEPERIFKT